MADRVRPASQEVVRAHEALAQIAAAAGGEIPRLKVPRRGVDRHVRARVERNFDGTLQVVIAANQIRQASDKQLLGVLAHEYAHVEYDDPEPTGPRWRAVLFVAVQVGFLFLVMIAGAGVGGILFGSAGKLVGLLFGVVFGISGFLLTESYSRRNRYERTGRDGPLRELRADLRAVQLVGRDAVLAMLDGHPVANQLDQRLHDIAPTHPTPRLRRAVTSNYEPTDAPLEAARALRQQYSAS
ncbi:M48 family metalloprotease (plasmid) [Kribbella sp. WER1]